MPQGPSKMRNEIIEIAFEHARKEGLSSLSIRSIAKECSVSVGTIYNYFPDKASLVTEVITKFWTSVAFSPETRTCLDYHEGENLILFCERLYRTMHMALMRFRSDWLGEVSSLDARTRQKGRQAENICFDHIYSSLEKVIASDTTIERDIVDYIGAHALARLIWTNMHQSLRANEADCAALLKLVSCALYPARPSATSTEAPLTCIGD